MPGPSAHCPHTHTHTVAWTVKVGSIYLWVWTWQNLPQQALSSSAIYYATLEKEGSWAGYCLWDTATTFPHATCTGRRGYRTPSCILPLPLLPRNDRRHTLTAAPPRAAAAAAPPATHITGASLRARLRGTLCLPCAHYHRDAPTDQRCLVGDAASGCVYPAAHLLTLLYARHHLLPSRAAYRRPPPVTAFGATEHAATHRQRAGRSGRFATYRPVSIAVDSGVRCMGEKRRRSSGLNTYCFVLQP